MTPCRRPAPSPSWPCMRAESNGSTARARSGAAPRGPTPARLGRDEQRPSVGSPSTGRASRAPSSARRCRAPRRPAAAEPRGVGPGRPPAGGPRRRSPRPRTPPRPRRCPGPAHGHLVTRQGAGLVGAHDGGGAQRLHRGQVPDDRVAARHPLHPDRQRDGDDRRQTLRDRRRPQGRWRQGGVGERIAAGQRHAEHDRGDTAMPTP